MTGDASPNGLHRRIAALEGRLVCLEAAMRSLQSAYAAASQPTGIPADATNVAGRMADTQGEYDDALLTLHELQSLSRRLRDWGLAPPDTVTWAQACRALGFPVGSGHRTLRSREPVLHVLLHRCAFPPYCSVDGVSYHG